MGKQIFIIARKMWVGGDFTLLPKNNKKEIKRLVINVFFFKNLKYQ
jgi:hypothetical protein